MPTGCGGKDLDSVKAVADGVADEAADVSVERLKELLEYVEQVIKLDERPAFKLLEYRLGNGQTFLFHEHELHALPGITHDLTDEDGAVWLCAERLKRNDPPKPSETLAPWLDLSSDPDRTPLPRDHLLKTVSKPECDELVASGQARVEDCAESLSADAKGQFDVRLRLEDRPKIAGEAEQYLSLSWLPWSVGERPRRRSIALYQKLFEVVQLSELGGAEQAIEMVWGIGLSRWIKDGAIIDLPLIERLVEIEIDERAAGTIRIRPRQAQAIVNLRPYEELKIEGAPVAQDAARRAIASVDDDFGVSPFQRETFEPVLRACQTRLDPEGTYLPDSQIIDPAAPPPIPSPNLVVSDRWVFFARKRSDNFLLQDLANRFGVCAQILHLMRRGQFGYASIATLVATTGLSNRAIITHIANAASLVGSKYRCARWRSLNAGWPKYCTGQATVRCWLEVHRTRPFRGSRGFIPRRNGPWPEGRSYV
jgi:hypothetical protein